MAPPYSSCNAPIVKHCDTPQLTRSQRSRLIKSTRKVTKILGENPMPQLGLNIPSPISFPRGKALGINAAALCSPIISVTKKFARVALEPLQIVYRRDSDTDSEGTRYDKSRPAKVETCHGGNWSPVLVFQTETDYESETESPVSSASSPFSSPTSSESTFGKRQSSLFSTSASASKSFLSLPSLAEWDKLKERREARGHRKRLAKLARHLGETIPPELILPRSGCATTKSKRGPSRRRRRRSYQPPPVARPPNVPSLPVAVESPSTEQGSPLSASPSPSLFDVLPPAVQKTVEVFGSADHTTVSMDVAQPRPWESEFEQRRTRSHSESSIPLPCELASQSHANEYFEANDHIGTASSVEDGHEPETSSLIIPQPRSESRMAFLRSRATVSSPEPGEVLHRSERRQGWSGEWNAASMRIVISKLRDLR